MSTQTVIALLIFVFLIPLACNQPAAEQREPASSGEAQFISGDRLHEAVLLDSTERATALTAEVLSNQGHYKYVVVRRQESGEPEVHANWADVTVVREGRGTLVYGGQVEGGQETDPGEVRGGNIVNGQQQQLAAGDVVVIPARVPHQIQLSNGESIVYSLVKVERPKSPNN